MTRKETDDFSLLSDLESHLMDVKRGLYALDSLLEAGIQANPRGATEAENGAFWLVREVKMKAIEAEKLLDALSERSLRPANLPTAA